MNRHDPNENELGRLEGLLRSAAAYEPPCPPPFGLAYRALASKRKRASRKTVVGIGLALSVVGAAAAIAFRGGPDLILDERSRKDHSTIKPVAFPPSNETAPRYSVRKKEPESTGVKISNAFEKRRVNLGGKKQRVRTVRPGKPPRAVVAKAEWHEETVHRFETGIIAPVMIATPDTESGATILQSSLIEIPMERREFVLPTGYDSSHTKLISNEENP